MSTELTEEEISKDKYFTQLASLSEEMTKDHGKDFAMGALVLAAQWIAKGQDSGAIRETVAS